jgi:hypothetical protein
MPTMRPAIIDSHGNPAIAGHGIVLDVLTCGGVVTIVDARAVTVVVVAVVNPMVTAMIVVYELVMVVGTPFDVTVDVLDSTRVMFDDMVVFVVYELVMVVVTPFGATEFELYCLIN